MKPLETYCMFLFHTDSQGIVSIDVKKRKALHTLHMLCLCNINTQATSESKCTSKIQHASECQMPLLDDQSTHCLVEAILSLLLSIIFLHLFSFTSIFYILHMFTIILIQLMMIYDNSQCVCFCLLNELMVWNYEHKGMCLFIMCKTICLHNILHRVPNRMIFNVMVDDDWLITVLLLWQNKHILYRSADVLVLDSI